ncbi:hypothetical protein PG993_014593 [Apiospora rasikravindrae]|uniref:DUF7492 domain-containing protein n=1 Tax=Apiospora rasikravindrae TaxID=990691 RepID=A0ABR1RN66_9PEZI
MSVFNFTQVLVLLTLVRAAFSHSWIEQVFRMNSDGSFANNPGYALGYMPRNAVGYSDDNVQNKILDPSSNPPVCRQFSQGDYLNSSFSPLQAAAGDYVALTYQENGHTTDPELTSRPYRGGLTHVYGTLQQKAGDKLNDVQKWNADQTGGNKKGKLLATHYYDDGQCYQNRGDAGPGFPIFMERKAKYGLESLNCQTDVQLPQDLPESGTYTMYWVWDWPQKPNQVGYVPEMYTSCIEIKLGPAPAKASSLKQGIKFAKQGKIDNMGIASQVNRMIEAATLGTGTASPPPYTGPTAGSGNGPVASASAPAPTGNGSYLPSPTGANGIKTVTVTAAPTTVTQYTTVTAGNGNQQTGPATASTLLTSVKSGSSAAAPTNNVPVASVTPFLKIRATGKARRDASAQ